MLLFILRNFLVIASSSWKFRRQLAHARVLIVFFNNLKTLLLIFINRLLNLSKFEGTWLLRLFLLIILGEIAAFYVQKLMRTFDYLKTLFKSRKNRSSRWSRYRLTLCPSSKLRSYSLLYRLSTSNWLISVLLLLCQLNQLLLSIWSSRFVILVPALTLVFPHFSPLLLNLVQKLLSFDYWPRNSIYATFRDFSCFSRYKLSVLLFVHGYSL
jgi:hypothetical protein